jgi:hypothetical protein
MKLSKNFRLKEFTRSQTAIRMGISNEIGEQELINLTWLVAKCIQPIREKHGPVVINSGFRCLDLNRAIGSGDGSAHVRAEASDIEALKISNYDLAKWATENLEFDQIILEFPGPDKRDGWVHIAYKSDGSNRNQVLTALKEEGKTVYKEGLIYEYDKS